MGIKGFVTAPDGTPLFNSTIEVGSILHPVRSSYNGDYWRLLMPGSYVVTASLPGYVSQSKSVQVMASGPSILNFTLTPSIATSAPIVLQSNLDALITQVNLLTDVEKQASVLSDAKDPDDSIFVHHNHQDLLDVLNSVKIKCSSIVSIYSIGLIFY